MSERTIPRHRRTRRQDHRWGGGDPRQQVAALVDAAVAAVLGGPPAQARMLIDLLAEGPPLPRSAELVATVLAEATARRRTSALADGWTEADLAELARHRLRLPAGSGSVERQVRLLALLHGLRPLPPVAGPRPDHHGTDPALLAKVRALLAKAESTTFPEEAEALSAKAQQLMARHRIERVLVEDRSGHPGGPVGRRIWLHDPYADARFRLLGAVATANRCQAVLLGGVGCAHVVGYPDDLDVVELLHTSLLLQATRAVTAAGPQVDERGRSRTRSFRRAFLMAYGWRIGQRLQEASTAAEAEADDGSDLLPVLARRDAEVESAVAAAFPDLRRTRVSITNGAGWAAGTAAADAADLGGTRLASDATPTDGRGPTRDLGPGSR